MMEPSDSKAHGLEVHSEHETNTDAVTSPPQPQDTRFFSPDEEKALLSESDALKAEANKLFAVGDYSQAVSQYDKALASCPRYLEYEVAVLKSNMAASHLKQEDWKAAVKTTSEALDCLARLVPMPKLPSPPKSTQEDEASAMSSSLNNDQAPKTKPDTSNDKDETVKRDSDTHNITTPLPTTLPSTSLSHSETEISRLRAKTLLRRARARSSETGWTALAGAEEDYRALLFSPSTHVPPPSTSSDSQSQAQKQAAYDAFASSLRTLTSPSSTIFPSDSLISHLSPTDARSVQKALRTDLPPRIQAAREREMGEMMGKLKELGNGLLKPFGLSTDMFKMEKQPGGGYSLSMGGGGGESK